MNICNIQEKHKDFIVFNIVCLSMISTTLAGAIIKDPCLYYIAIVFALTYIYGLYIINI